MNQSIRQNGPRRDCCEFNCCSCYLFVGYKDQPCKSCGHGECWHKLIRVSGDIRFESTRACAPVHPDSAQPE